MAGTKLDRSNTNRIASSSGIPDTSTRGNIRIGNDRLYFKPEGSSEWRFTGDDFPDVIMYHGGSITIGDDGFLISDELHLKSVRTGKVITINAFDLEDTGMVYGDVTYVTPILFPYENETLTVSFGSYVPKGSIFIALFYEDLHLEDENKWRVLTRNGIDGTHLDILSADEEFIAESKKSVVNYGVGRSILSLLNKNMNANSGVVDTLIANYATGGTNQSEISITSYHADSGTSTINEEARSIDGASLFTAKSQSTSENATLSLISESDSSDATLSLLVETTSGDYAEMYISAIGPGSEIFLGDTSTEKITIRGEELGAESFKSIEFGSYDVMTLHLWDNSTSDRTLIIRSENIGTGDADIQIAADNKITLDASGGTGEVEINVGVFDVNSVSTVNITGTNYLELETNSVMAMKAGSFTMQSSGSGGLQIYKEGELPSVFESTARLKLDDNIWLLGRDIYDINFTSGYINTVDELWDSGIRAMPGLVTGMPFLEYYYLADTLNSFTGPFSFDGTWVFNDSAGIDDGWQPSGLTTSGNDEMTMMIFPLNRSSNWEVIVEYHVGEMTAGQELICGVGACAVGGEAPFFTAHKYNTTQKGKATLNINKGDSSFLSTDQDSDLTSWDWTYKMGLRHWNGVVSKMNPSTNTWEDYTERSGVGNVQNLAIQYGLDHIFIFAGHESGSTLPNGEFTIRNLEFRYLR